MVRHRSFPSKAKKFETAALILSGYIFANQLCGSPQNKAEIIFDGFPPRGNSSQSDTSQIRIIYSGKASADDSIKSIIERHGTDRNIRIVSDDKEIVSFGRIYQVEVVPVEEFLKIAKMRASSSVKRKIDSAAKDLNYTQVSAINEELKKKWLK